MYPFVIDREYSKRKEIFPLIGVPEGTRGGSWDTGYNRYKNDFFIFCNIGVAGRTGHDYKNYFEGEYLHWEAKNGTNIHQQEIKTLLNPPGYVYLFYRSDNTSPFIFAGTCIPVFYRDKTPVPITWKILQSHEIANSDFKYEPKLTEGKPRLSQLVSHERNPEARRRCIKLYGYKCSICRFDFAKVYGNELGKDFIHVHHISLLSEVEHERFVDPISDLRPVCPNCHAMLHRRFPVLSIEELKQIYDNQQ